MTVNNQDQKKKSFLRKMFSSGEGNGKKMTRPGNGTSDTCSDSSVQSTFSSNRLSIPIPSSQIQSFKVFVATWNVGGNCPDGNLNLDDLLQVNSQSDIYVLGFQEIVPLNAGNVLVAGDNEPATKWLELINQSLNRTCYVNPKGTSRTLSPLSSPLPFQKPSLKKICKNFRSESAKRLKTCNCASVLEKKNSRDFCTWCPNTNVGEDGFSSEDDNDGPGSSYVSSEVSNQASFNPMKYSLVVGKQMVGIFLTVWMRTELVQYVSHMRACSIGRGIMGCLGNKGCISVSMCFHQTSICFVCSHLASGEKEGDELRRNSDVIEILRTTQFPRICRNPQSQVPDNILHHDRLIWLGDLNYRIALSYSETRKLLERFAWDALLAKDQLKIERDAGRVFRGWKEGKIYFAPTYKYSYNSDIYAGETVETKSKRRTPAWCDRILWHGNGVRQLTYVRWESRFSDHRPVCATFMVDVEVVNGGPSEGSCGFNVKVASEEHLPMSNEQ